MDTIKNLRKIIDVIDEQILDLIKSRMEVVIEIGQAKKETKAEIVDQTRELEIYKRLMEKAEEKGIDPAVVKKVWKLLIEAAYEAEGEKDGNS
jgi:chorismate mutase